MVSFSLVFQVTAGKLSDALADFIVRVAHTVGQLESVSLRSFRTGVRFVVFLSTRISPFLRPRGSTNSVPSFSMLFHVATGQLLDAGADFGVRFAHTVVRLESILLHSFPPEFCGS